MRISNISKGVVGSRILYENAYRYAYMIQEEAKKRIQILTFWSKHGLQATKDINAFQDKMSEWLLWYNTERPHEGIGLVSPMWYFSTLLVNESHSG